MTRSNTIITKSIIIVVILSCIPLFVHGNNIEEVKPRYPTIVSDSNDNAIIIWENAIGFDYKNLESKDYRSCVIINSDGKITMKKDIDFAPSIGGRIQLAIDDQDILYMVGLGSYIEGEHQYLASINYIKFDIQGNILMEEKKISNDRNAPNTPYLVVDDNENAYVIYDADSIENTDTNQIFFIKIDSSNNILLDNIQITNDDNINSIDYLNQDSVGNLLLKYREGSHEYYMILDMSANVILDKMEILKSQYALNFPVISGNDSNLQYLDNNGIVDSNNDVHIITSNSASLLYTKLNSTGTKLIENKTIATHKGNGPAIYDPKVAIDSEDNIHITSSGAGSIYYMKIDPNGTVLIPAMKIAPEDEKGKDSKIPGFELIPLIIVVVVAAAVMRRRR